jgi:hypothetical protein
MSQVLPGVLAGVLLLSIAWQPLSATPPGVIPQERIVRGAPPDELPDARLLSPEAVRPAIPGSGGNKTSIQQVVEVRQETSGQANGIPRMLPESIRGAQGVSLDRPIPVSASRGVGLLPAVPLLAAHAKDYRWLIGQLSRDPIHNRWLVRYAAVGEIDVLGGTLLLVNPGQMNGFHDGQVVRVEGHLVDPAPHEVIPAYRILALQPVHP